MQLRHIVGNFLFCGLAACSGAVILPSGDTARWGTYEIDLDETTVRFSIPPGESPDWPAFDIPRRIALNDASLFNEAHEGPRLLARFWDYRKGRFDNVYGTLSARIILWSSDVELSDLSALQNAFETNERLWKERDIRNGGTGGPEDSRTYEKAQVGGEPALLVHHTTSQTHYIAPIDLHHYIIVGVLSDVSPSRWREDSLAAAHAILESLRIERRQLVHPRA